MTIKAISQPRFEVLCFMRHPAVKIIGEEREWYSDDDENVLGVVIFDRPKDWLYVILGRDEVARFRAIDQQINYATDADARNALHKKMTEYSKAGESVFPQGLEQKNQKTFLIFKPVVSRDRLHPDFIVLTESNGYSSAREIIKEVAYTFEDPDGNYIQQFQTTGFDARLWELYLYAVLHEMDFVIDHTYKAPDYICSSLDGTVIVIEATTANKAHQQEDEGIAGLSRIEIGDFVAVRFGSALYSKLQKRYWEKDHVRGHPFVVAVTDFRRPEGLEFCAPFLMEYLYGLRQNEGPEGVTYTPINEHSAHKTIPSGFFNLPDSENVSAILFSESGTISKFNRMGKIAGFGDPSIVMARVGERFPDKESAAPEPFQAQVEGQYRETWAEGIWIFHNPKAKIPIERGLFPDVAHVYLEHGGFEIYLSDTFPTWSKTLIFSSAL